jgi:hypothetical protein
MTVEFNPIGPGQSVRLAYQVMGSNGPVNNPSRIRYLAPTDPLAQAAGLAGSVGGGVPPGLLLWSSASQFATPCLSPINLGVTLQTLSDVRQLRQEVEVVQRQIVRVQETADNIEENALKILVKVERIDINVAEGNLRSALNHVMTVAVTDVTVDLETLSSIEGDLHRFTESLDSFDFGLARGLKFSSDVRDLMHACLDLYRGARFAAMRRYNSHVFGGPLAVVHEEPGYDLGSLTSAITRTPRRPHRLDAPRRSTPLSPGCAYRCRRRRSGKEPPGPRPPHTHRPRPSDAAPPAPASPQTRPAVTSPKLPANPAISTDYRRRVSP